MKLLTFEQLEALVTLSGDISADLLTHPSYVYSTGMGTAHASNEVDEAKYDLECTEAMMQERIRAEAVVANEKVTETLVLGRVKNSDEYGEAHTNYLAKKRVYGEWRALESAFDSRGHSLHNLVELATKRGVDSSGASDYKAAREAAARSRQNASSSLPRVKP